MKTQEETTGTTTSEQPEQRTAKPSRKRPAKTAKAAPKAKATAKTAKGGEAAKTAKGRKAPAPAKDGKGLRPESKGAKVLALISRPKGATLAEIMKATDWQAHSVRGFISGNLGKKQGLKVESSKNDSGERAYTIVR
jgi:hypothetical protein